jgi:hypothetical protein
LWSSCPPRTRAGLTAPISAGRCASRTSLRDAACPISHVDARVDVARFGIARGIGRGPAYPIGITRGVLYLAQATGRDAGSPWAGGKVLWFGHPHSRGPVLIRGRRLISAGRL